MLEVKTKEWNDMMDEIHHELAFELEWNEGKLFEAYVKLVRKGWKTEDFLNLIPIAKENWKKDSEQYIMPHYYIDLLFQKAEEQA